MDDPRTGDLQALLDVQDVAQVLNVSRRTVWRLVATGRLPAVRLGPQVVRFRHQDLQRLVRELTHHLRNRVAAQPEHHP